MKEGTLHSLMVAKNLLEEAVRQIGANERYLSTSGLIVLQDCLEIVLLALLNELGVDEIENLEKKSFDELIAAIRKAGITIPKSGVLKALNKERVVAKHYGQLVEPNTATNYLKAAELAIDAMSIQVIRKSLVEVFLHDLVKEGEAKNYLAEAQAQIGQREFIWALFSIRKALYVEFESAYDVSAHASQIEMPYVGFTNTFNWYCKAPQHCQNAQWIANNVQSPLDFIQLDYGEIRQDALLWGVSPAEVENILRLTPRVYKCNDYWLYEQNGGIKLLGSSQEHALSCLDKAIHIIRKCQQYKDSHKWIMTSDSTPIQLAPGTTIFRHASDKSVVVGAVDPKHVYTEFKRLNGFDGRVYSFVQGRDVNPESITNQIGYWGYVVTPST